MPILFLAFAVAVGISSGLAAGEAMDVPDATIRFCAVIWSVPL